VFAGDLQFFVPAASIPAGGITATNWLRDFDPFATGHTSNYGNGYEPGGAPGNTCTNVPNNDNCTQLALSPYTPPPAGAYSFFKSIASASKGALTDGVIGQNEPFTVKATFIHNTTAGTISDQVLCDKFDPTR